MSTKGVLLYCFNTPNYRYDLIAAKSVPLIKKNLGLDVTVITDWQTFKQLPHMGSVDYRLIEPEKTNNINQKPWYNLERHRAFELSPYDTTILLDIDYFCYTDQLLQYANTEHDFWIHDQVHDVTGKGSYDFNRNSIIPMLWATVIVFKKTKRVRAIFEMVRHVKKFYQHYCSLYRIDFRNFRNDYAFSIALHQIDGMRPNRKIPSRLPTLPALAVVKHMNDKGVVWEMDDQVGYTEDTDLHVIDKGVAYV